MGVLRRILTDPKTIITGVIAGFVVGFYFKDLAPVLKPLAEIYVALLSMCLLPILVSALIWGIGQMLRNPNTRVLFGRMAGIYVVGLLVPCIIGFAVAAIFQPGGNLPDDAAAALGGQLAAGAGANETGGLLVFLHDIVPANVFDALSQGKFINIVFFCALVGMALGVVKSKTADLALDVVNALYQTFTTLFGWVLIPLPIGLFCIVGASIAEADTKLLLALINYVIYFYVAGILVLAVYFFAMAVVAKKAPWTAFADLKAPLVLAFATDNTFIALYSAIEALQERFGVRREIADTIAPFGIVANQHGQILLFTFTSAFLVQIYGIDLGVGDTAILALGCIVAGTAAVGGGPVLAPILAPVLLGAGVPDALAFVVLTTAAPAVARVASTLTVTATCTLAVLTAKGAPDPAAAPLDGGRVSGAAE